MFHPHVTDAQNVLELGVNIPAVFVYRGQVEEADSSLAHNTNKLTACKDVKDEIFKTHGDGLEEQCIHGGTHNKSSYPSWWKNRSRNGLLTFLCWKPPSHFSNVHFRNTTKILQHRFFTLNFMLILL